MARTKNLEKRLKALESECLSRPVMLHFADGSTSELRGPRYFLCQLFSVSRRGANRTSVQEEQLELIRQVVCIEEPGGGHMAELIRIMLDSDDSVPPGQSELDASEGAFQWAPDCPGTEPQ